MPAESGRSAIILPPGASSLETNMSRTGRCTVSTLAGAIAAMGMMLCAPVEGATWYVRASASGANNGTGWTDAFVSLQSALAAAGSGDEIRVAAGTYRPAAPSGPQTATFQLQSRVRVLGGYAGTGPDPDARDPVANVT